MSDLASRPRVYAEDRRRCIAMPMGGIGTGSFALCGDGSLRQWQIINFANHGAYIPGGFFVVWAEPEDGKPVAKLLQTDEFHYEKDFKPAPSVSDHFVPEELKRLHSAMPGVAGTKFVGEYPIAEITYLDDELPVKVSLEAFSPFAPLNSKESGLPAVIFNFTIKNPEDSAVKVSLAGSLQNAVGWDTKAEILGVKCDLYGGNVNTVVSKQEITAVAMSNSVLPKNAPGNGTMTLAVLEEADSAAAWTDYTAFRRDFWEDGRLEASPDVGPTPAGETINASVAVPFTLEPGAEKTITYVIAWHFPNHYVNWGQKGFGVEDTKSCFWLGNMYSNWFADALEVVEHIRLNIQELTEMTRLFQRTFYDSTLPYWFLDAISSQIATLRSPTCLWNEDGVLHGFEGCCGTSTGTTHKDPAGGCCPMDCTHVWNYEHTISRLFPELERTMRFTDLKVQMREDGQVPYRAVLPLYLKRWPDAPCADGQCGTILKTYREFLQSGDKAFLDDYWPEIKKAVNYIFEKWDQDGDGVMDGAQWNTYDCDVYGKNSFIGTEYLAALRAAEEMAKIQSEEDLAAKYRERFENGRRVIEDELWNGEYYIQLYDAEKHKDHQYGTGCHSDQVLGQWWAHSVGLGYLLDPARVRKALESIYKHNFRQDFAGFEQKPRVYVQDHEKGLLCCTWPKGGRPEGQVILYSDEVWTGIEYQVAGHMLYEGMVDEAFQIIQAARDRQNGTVRNPWNDVECGDHYVRPMSSWLMLEAAGGFHYDGHQQAFSFAPRLDGEFRSFFIAGTCWGTFTWSGDELTVKPASGEARIRCIRLGSSPSKASAELNGRRVEASVKGGAVELSETVLLRSGDTFSLRI